MDYPSPGRLLGLLGTQLTLVAHYYESCGRVDVRNVSSEQMNLYYVTQLGARQTHSRK